MQNPSFFRPLALNNFLALKFRAQAVFKLFEKHSPGVLKIKMFQIFGLFYIISSQVINIHQILRSSICYAKLKAISNLFKVF